MFLRASLGFPNFPLASFLAGSVVPTEIALLTPIEVAVFPVLRLFFFFFFLAFADPP